MRAFLGQQPHLLKHQKRLMCKQSSHLKLSGIVLLSLTVLITGCIKPSNKRTTALLLDTSNATKQQLISQVNGFAKVGSMRAKMDLEFEDNSFGKQGIAEKYKTANSEIVVQRPSKILLKVKVPFIGTDVVQMTSDGVKFRVAVLQDGGSGKYKKFLVGTVNEDYSSLQKKVAELENGNSKELRKNVNAFANIRPQHFTDALLMRPTDNSKYTYLISTILQEEIDLKLLKKKSPVAWVLRGYYLLDEYAIDNNGSKRLARRFWFDRVGGINLARQQIFDAKGEIASDIIYGQVGSITENGGHQMPLQVTLTRPQEKYKVTLKYQSPKNVSVGKIYQDRVFALENRWNLEELDLDKKLKEMTSLKNIRTANQSDKAVIKE